MPSVNTSNKEENANPSGPSANSNVNTDFEVFASATSKLWLEIKKHVNYVMIDLGGYQIFDTAVKWCVQNPVIAICLLAGAASILVPIIVMIVISTMVYIGFLVLEGTLLTFLSIIFFGCLGALALVLTMFVLIAMLAGFGFFHMYELCSEKQNLKQAKISQIHIET